MLNVFENYLELDTHWCYHFVLGISQAPPPYTGPSVSSSVGGTQPPMQAAPVGVFNQGARFNDKTKPTIPVSVCRYIIGTLLMDMLFNSSSR